MEKVRERIAQRALRVPPSGIRKFFDIIATMPDVISLGVGEPDFITPDPIRRAGIQALEVGETHYTSNLGILALREEISRHLERLYGVRYDPASELVITVGVSEGLLVSLLALIDPGDEVVVPEPSFVAYKPGVLFAGGEPVVVETRVEDGFQLQPKELAAAITSRTKALLIGYPNNPTGAVIERELLLEIAEVAERNDLLIFSDEIYDRLVYGIEHTCFASLPGMRERTVLLGGFSKDYAMTGWRVGYLAAPKELMPAVAKMHQYAIMCAPTMSQIAALEAMKNGEDYVQAMHREYNERRKFIVHGLTEIGLPCFEPRGAFYAFPSVSGTGMTSEEFSEKLLFSGKVAVVPGSAFGACGEGFIRCSYATSLPKIEEALGRMERFLKKQSRVRKKETSG